MCCCMGDVSGDVYSVLELCFDGGPQPGNLATCAWTMDRWWSNYPGIGVVLTRSCAKLIWKSRGSAQYRSSGKGVGHLFGW